MSDNIEFVKKAKRVTQQEQQQLYENVRGIIGEVRNRGDAALHDFSMKFDKMDRKSFRISEDEIEQGIEAAPSEIKSVTDFAIEHVRKFAEKQMECYKDFEVENSPGAFLGQRVIPISSAGCYVPGGRFPLLSCPIMPIVPAKVAGVERVVACTPLRKGGLIDPAVLYSLAKSGADEIYGIGGAQAIAAMAYGTETIHPVDKIVGPGNMYVNEAKRQVFGRVGIDLLAGPSEVLILADDSAKPELVAIDLLAQAEHDTQARAILITDSQNLARETIKQVHVQMETLNTASILRESWENRGEVVVTKTIDQAVELANSYAPEHLEVHTRNPKEIQSRLRNYGSLFLGEWSPVVLSDKLDGTNHILPTLGAARYTGGLFVGSFLKTVTYQMITEQACKQLAAMAAKQSHYEGLDGHARSAEARL